MVWEELFHLIVSILCSEVDKMFIQREAISVSFLFRWYIRNAIGVCIYIIKIRF